MLIMIKFIFCYIVIGFIIGGFIWHDICKRQTDDEKRRENPATIIALPSLIFLWPVSIAIYIRYKLSNHANSK